MSKKRVLTGMQASGDPHLGNYFGMMQQTVGFQNTGDYDCFYFVADLHAFTTKRDPEVFSKNQHRCVIDWLALGIDVDQSTFYRQSDLAGLHTELSWYLSCFTPVGLLERAHSFKDKKARGLEANAGLFTYPVLMAADILLYDADIVPVGKDQKQHVEMARDIAQKFNHEYGETFILPESKIEEAVATIPGLDGQKMSKSYGNTIEIFAEEKDFKKKIMSIQTDSVEMGQSLDPESCHVFALHKLFGNPNLSQLEVQYKEGAIGFGDAKKQLFELAWEYFREARERREKLVSDPAYVESVLQKGAAKAGFIAQAKLQDVRKKLGLDHSA